MVTKLFFLILLDDNECNRLPSPCRGNAQCVNTPGSFECACPDGYKLGITGRDCADVDECRLLLGICRNGRCRNTVGSFSCECADGYTLTGDGQNCRDINECTELPGTCPAPGKCQNLMGSFVCSCPAGYELMPDGNTCADVNECLVDENLCDEGDCINTQGSFKCECPTGYVLSSDGKKCVDVREELCFNTFRNGGRGSCSDPRTTTMTKTQSEFEKLCPSGAGRGPKGEDLNECSVMPGICEGGECVNTDGSFRCECPMGFVLDSSGVKCVDDNECAVSNICRNGTCTNVEGGFECDCTDGFAPGPMQICEDVDSIFCPFKHGEHERYKKIILSHFREFFQL
uniref:EGF-like domain-containing protein n=1 Tax=Daphnia galeata TaxID=27404 RepID=A0A8J2S3R6_9CRUS|nr:unnamed protein product [Daphnia galeata]